jgi:hypothetical protein
MGVNLLRNDARETNEKIIIKRELTEIQDIKFLTKPPFLFFIFISSITIFEINNLICDF